MSALGIRLPMASSRPLGRVWPGITKPSEAEDLAADQDCVGVGQPVRLIDEQPGPVAAPQVAKLDLARGVDQLGMQRREIGILGEREIRALPAHAGDRAIEREFLGDGSAPGRAG